MIPCPCPRESADNVACIFSNAKNMVASSLETVMLASIFVMKKKRLLFLSCFSEKYRDKTPYHGHDNANHLFEYLYDDYVKQKHT